MVYRAKTTWDHQFHEQNTAKAPFYLDGRIFIIVPVEKMVNIKFCTSEYRASLDIAVITLGVRCQADRY